MTFLNRCIHHKIIPKSLQIKPPSSSQRVENLMVEHRRKLLVATKNDTKCRYFSNLALSKTITDSIKEVLSTEDFNTIIRVTESSREKKFLETREKLKKKFELLYSAKFKRNFSKESDQKAVKSCVLNLAGDVTEEQLQILNLGPKFAVTPKDIPYMDIITTTEVEALNLERNEQHSKAEFLRHHVKKILLKEKKPRCNLNKEQLRTIDEMKKDPDVDIFPFDKGNGFVRLTKATSKVKMIEGIGTTTILTKDPTVTHMKKIQRTLLAIKKETNMPKELYRKLYPSDAIPPRAYGQCKAHKPTKDYPFRVLVSTIGTAPYRVSEYLVKIIQPTLSKSSVMVKNSKAFVDEAKTWTVDPDEIQVSYDAVALYPSVPIKKAIDNLMSMLQDDIDDFKTRTVLELKHVKQLLEVCLEKSYFLWNNEIHCLQDSGPIGLSLMVVLAESYLQMLENKALDIASNRRDPVAPITHKRYVDDTHDRFKKKEESIEFLSILNEQEPRIQWTAEYENTEKELNYMDITTKNCNNKYVFKVYRKDAITNVQIKPNSCHDDKIKNGVFKGYILRAKNICSKEYLPEEIKFIKKIFVENGYDEKQLDKMIQNVERQKTRKESASTDRYASLPWIPGLSQKLKKVFKRANCQVSFKSPRNLESILTSKNKPKLPVNSQPGVYFVPTECKAGYTGETKKKVSTRNTEHEKSVFEGDYENDAIAEHSQTCPCTIKWENTKTLAVEPIWFRRKVRESLEIRRLKTGPGNTKGLNRDNGDYVTTDTWIPLLDKVNLNKYVRTFESMTSNTD